MADVFASSNAFMEEIGHHDDFSINCACRPYVIVGTDGNHLQHRKLLSQDMLAVETNRLLKDILSR